MMGTAFGNDLARARSSNLRREIPTEHDTTSTMISSYVKAQRPGVDPRTRKTQEPTVHREWESLSQMRPFINGCRTVSV